MLTETFEKKTYLDYDQLPEGAPYQLINGELTMNPAPNFFHQQLVTRVAHTFSAFVEGKELGEVVVSPIDVYLTDTEVYQPDVVFIAQGRMDIVVEGRIKGAPDIVVEVLSPSTAYYDLSHKKNVYESSGVKEYWILYPEDEIIEVFENVNGEFTQVARKKREGVVASSALNGFSVDLKKVF
jgi:Uma2 family endonuclease